MTEKVCDYNDVKLMGDNYVTWSGRFRDYLDGESLSEFLTTEMKLKKENEMRQRMVLARLKSSLLEDIRETISAIKYDTPYQLWQELFLMFGKIDNVQKVCYLNELTVLQLGPLTMFMPILIVWTN